MSNESSNESSVSPAFLWGALGLSIVCPILTFANYHINSKTPAWITSVVPTLVLICIPVSIGLNVAALLRGGIRWQPIVGVAILILGLRWDLVLILTLDASFAIFEYWIVIPIIVAVVVIIVARRCRS